MTLENHGSKKIEKIINMWKLILNNHWVEEKIKIDLEKHNITKFIDAPKAVLKVYK